MADLSSSHVVLFENVGIRNPDLLSTVGSGCENLGK